MMNDMLSQEEIDALLKGDSTYEEENPGVFEGGSELTDIEKDALGEIGNINMGNSATTLSTILGKKVVITTPKVDMVTIEEISKEHPVPFVVVQVRYTEGLTGFNLLILKEKDVKVITSLMMGGDGATDLPEELNEIHLSAISEAMNQMIGSSATSLSEMISKKIDISPPEVYKMNFSDREIDLQDLHPDQKVIRVSFNMKIGELVDSDIMQLLPIDFAKELVNNMLYEDKAAKTPKKEAPAPKVEKKTAPPQEKSSASTQTRRMAPSEFNESSSRRVVKEDPVNMNSVEFEEFDQDVMMEALLPENIDLIKDVMLNISVELGRTSRSINEILDFGPGTIIELEKLVGEPLDILVNGKNIAKGEVVVIDENYGVRITDILKPDKRLKSL